MMCLIDQVINMLGQYYRYYFCRTHQGADCDLLLAESGKFEWVEVVSKENFREFVGAMEQKLLKIMVGIQSHLHHH